MFDFINNFSTLSKDPMKPDHLKETKAAREIRMEQTQGGQALRPRTYGGKPDARAERKRWRNGRED